MRTQAIGLLFAVLSLTGGAVGPGVAVASPPGEYNRGLDEPAPFDLEEAEKLLLELLQPLTSVSSDEEISWRVTELAFDPKFQQLLSDARNHLISSQLSAIPVTIPIKPEYAHLVNLCQLSIKMTNEELAAWGQELPPLPSIADIVYSQEVPEWLRLGIFDGISAHFCLSVLLSLPVDEESARLLSERAQRGFERLIRTHVAVMEREQMAVPAEIAALELGRLDIEALEAEEELRDEKLAEWFGEA